MSSGAKHFFSELSTPLWTLCKTRNRPWNLITPEPTFPNKSSAPAPSFVPAKPRRRYGGAPELQHRWPLHRAHIEDGKSEGFLDLLTELALNSSYSAAAALGFFFSASAVQGGVMLFIRA